MSMPDTKPSETTVQPVVPTPVAPIPPKSKLSMVLVSLVVLLLVGGGGIFLGKQMSTPAIPTPTLTPVVAVPTATTNPTANWQVYSANNDLKKLGVDFSFKYPVSLSLKDFTSERTQTAQPYQVVLFDSKYSTTDYFNHGWIDFSFAPYNLTDKFTSTTDPSNKSVNKQPYKLGDIDATKITVEHRDGSVLQLIDAKLPSSNFYFSTGIQGAETTALSNYFDQILSTFKFASQTSLIDTSNWKTYTSQLGKYTLKYPSAWYQHEEKRDQTTPVLSLSAVSNTSESTSGQTIWVEVNDNLNNLSIDQFAQTQSSANPNWQIQMIGGLEGKRSLSLPGQFNNDSVFVKKGQQIYRLTLIKSPAGPQVSTDTFNQILNSFQFTQ